VLEGEREELKYLCLIKHTVMKISDKVKAFLTSTLSAVK
jgi:hypothetical protein